MKLTFEIALLTNHSRAGVADNTSDMCQMSCRTFQSNALLSAGVCQEAKAKKIVSKKERREKKMFSSKDDEHFLLTGVKLADRRG